jgi:hypothetical protein
MIAISGTITRTFILPSPPAPALVFFNDINRVIDLIPHITLVHTYSRDEIRALYESQELGSYTIRIYSDLVIERRWDENMLEVYTAKISTAVPIEPTATMRETTGYGIFAIQVQLFDLGNQTRIEFTNKLQAQLIRPKGMSLMPKRVVTRIAQGITENRNKEIADGFIKNAIESFNEWLVLKQENISNGLSAP